MGNPEPSRQARAVGNVLVQTVAPMPLPVASVRDWDCQCQQCFDQTVAKWQLSLLHEEQCKRARTPPQADPEDAPSVITPNMKGAKTATRDVRGPGTVWIDN